MSVLKHTMLSLDYASRIYSDSEVNFAILLHDCAKRKCHEDYGNTYNHEELGLPLIKSFCIKWKVPNSYRDLALLVCKHHTRIHGCMGRGANSWMRPKSIYKLFQETNALCKPERFKRILNCCIADKSGRGATPEQIKEFENKSYPQAEYLLDCLNAVKNLDTKKVSSKLLEQGKSGIQIGEAIRIERINVIRGVQNKWKNKD